MPNTRNNSVSTGCDAPNLSHRLSCSLLTVVDAVVFVVVFVVVAVVFGHGTTRGIRNGTCDRVAIVLTETDIESNMRCKHRL